MSGIGVSAGAIRYSADIAWYDIKDYAYRGGCYYLPRPKADMNSLFHNKKKEELRSIGEGPGWPSLAQSSPG